MTYGQCSDCGYDLAPVWFMSTDDYDRRILCCDYLLCEQCGSRVMVDMVRAIENGIGIKCLVKVIPSKTKTVTFNIEPHGC